MPLANNVFFRPKPGRFGVNAAATAVAIGTGGITVTASATTSVHIPVPNRKCQLVSLNVLAVSAAAGGSTITVQAIKRNNQSGSPANVNLTAATSIKNDVITQADSAYNLAITGTDAQCVFVPQGSTYKGDTLRVDIAAATTVTTAPQVQIVAEWAFLA